MPRRSSVGRVMSSGRAVRGNRMVVFVATGSVAFVAGRRIGRAVVRNRARRIMRAAWRVLARGPRNDVDIAFVARGAIRGAKTQDLVDEMRELLARGEP